MWYTYVTAAYHRVTVVYFTKEYFDELKNICFIHSLTENATYNVTTNTLYLNGWESVENLTYMYGDAFISKILYLDYFGGKSLLFCNLSNSIIIIKQKVYAREMKSIALAFSKSHFVLLDNNEDFETDEKSNIIYQTIVLDINKDGEIVENKNKSILFKNKIMDLGDIINEINITETSDFNNY